MLAALLLLLIGTADVFRSRLGRRWAILGIAASWVFVLVVFVGGLGVALWWAAIPVAAGCGWLASTTADPSQKSRVGLGASIALLALIALFVAFDATGGTPSGFVVDWHQDASSALIRVAPLSTVVLAVAVAVFLVESANVIVRSALRSAADPVPEVVPVVASGSRSLGDRLKSLLGSTEPPGPSVEFALKGGRWIGPLERVLLVSLMLTGLYAVAGAVIAAKGIVRFPEISRDAAGGSKAEYFLVGSMVSWTIAVAAAGLLALSAHG